MHQVARLILAAWLFAPAFGAAQSFCASDGIPQPAGLLERFINADCEACWRDIKTARPRPGELPLDWIVPGGRGEDAPLAVAATRDSRARLQALGRKAPLQSEASSSRRQGSRPLRLALGPPFNGYVGTSIELKPARGGPWRAWLLLVETLPAGTEGSPVERNLVRNVFQPPWDEARALSKEQQERLVESRPMSIPDGARASRLSLVGWVEDARGRIRAIARTRCVPE